MTTQEEILKRMLDRTSDKLDKREGSIIYDALAPASVELQQKNIEIETVYNEMFADTQSREYLIRRAGERGLKPYPATYSIVKAEILPTTLNVEIGSRFSCEEVNYKITDNLGNGEYLLQCETVGEIGNLTSGVLLPIDNIQGLVSAEIVNIEVYGEEEEDTEIFRKRYYKSLDSEAFAGNKADYIAKTKSQAGVGGVKVYGGQEWNGGGTVKLVILSNHYDIPSDTLIDNLQTYFDPLENQGLGNGIAPIGHFVTVVPVDKIVVNITINITYDELYNWSIVQNDVEKAIDNYFLDLNEQWENTNNIVVRLAQIESRILNVEGVIDVKNATINSRAENLIIDKDAIVVRGTINE